jgi:hypothetical protein
MSRLDRSTPTASARSPSAMPRAAVRWLHVICWVLVIHGSLYPWSFAWPQAGFQLAWKGLWSPATLWSGLGDVVGNIVLFVPLGVVMFLDFEAMAVRRSWQLVLVIGTLLALALQVLQIFVPARDPELSDVVWNSLGLVLGLLAAHLLRRTARGSSETITSRHLRFGLIVIWLTIEWWPLVPTIDWQHVKDALKPLWMQAQWKWSSFLEETLLVMSAARLLGGTRRPTSMLVGLAVLVLLGKFLIVEQVISLPRACGLGLGLLLVVLLRGVRPDRSDMWIAVASVLWLSFDEMLPFAFADTFGNFSAIPFVALLNGSLSANALSLLILSYWVGVTMLLACDLGARPMPLAVGLGLWLLLLEGLQTLLEGRVADITPALVPGIWALMLQSGGLAPPAASRPARRR